MNNAITADSSIKEITAEIRRQCRAIAKAARCKVSVTKSEYTGGRAVYVTITASERNHLCPIYRAFEKANPHAGMYDFVNPRDIAHNRMHLADWAIELLAQLNSVVDSFNWNNSDIMTDYYHVNFYAYVDFCSNVENDAKAVIDAELNEIEATDEVTDEAIDDLESLGVDELRELLERETARRKEIETQVLRADLIKRIEGERQHIRILEGRLNGHL